VGKKKKKERAGKVRGRDYTLSKERSRGKKSIQIPFIPPGGEKKKHQRKPQGKIKVVQKNTRISDKEKSGTPNAGPTRYPNPDRKSRNRNRFSERSGNQRANRCSTPLLYQIEEKGGSHGRTVLNNNNDEVKETSGRPPIHKYLRKKVFLLKRGQGD